MPGQAGRPKTKTDSDVRMGIHLTAEEKAQLDEIVMRRHPGRDRMHSTTLGELIAEEYARMQSDIQSGRQRAKPA